MTVLQLFDAVIHGVIIVDDIIATFQLGPFQPADGFLGNGTLLFCLLASTKVIPLLTPPTAAVINLARTANVIAMRTEMRVQSLLRFDMWAIVVRVVINTCC